MSELDVVKVTQEAIDCVLITLPLNSSLEFKQHLPLCLQTMNDAQVTVTA